MPRVWLRSSASPRHNGVIGVVDTPGRRVENTATVRAVRRLVLLVTTIALVSGACADDDPPQAVSPSTTMLTRPPAADAPPIDPGSIGIDVADEGRCDVLVASRCLLPFPNDHFTRADATAPTGRRVAFDRAALPANASGIHIDPADLNRSDGFGPGSTLVAEVTEVDLTASRAPMLRDATRSLDDDSPIVVWDATGRTRVEVWAELDANADPGEQPLLLIHPVRNFLDGHRVVVGLRDLRHGDGSPVAASAAFAAYRDGQRTTDAVFEQRREAMERVLSDLGEAGVRRGSLQLAWDFTVASTANITGRLVAIRDQVFGDLGAGGVPSFDVLKVTDDPDPRVARQIDGTFEVPLFLTASGEPGGRLVLDDRGIPQRQPGRYTAEFRCSIPPAALDTPARMALYGHGLFGDLGEVGSAMVRDLSARSNIVYCATNWYGMTEADVPSAAGILGDLSGFGALPDRLHQGILAFLLLGRLMTSESGFSSQDAFRSDGASVLDRGALYYDGNSQGAILGGTLAAVSTEIRRVVLGEAGMNYSLLLDRSVDFDEYLAVYRPAYPSRFDRFMGIQLIQMLWDRAETNGYANHLTGDPLPGTPAKPVLLLGAIGDHQVSEYSLRAEARTLGAAARLPLAGRDRVAEDDPAAGMPALDDSRRNGSAYFLWDTGSPASPSVNTPAREGHDPHDDTPNIAEAQLVKDAFLRLDGTAPDPCAADQPCTAPVPEANADG